MNARVLVTSAVALTVVAAAALAGDAPKPVRHPHFDDKGALSWSTKLAEAQAAAKSQDRLIFIEYGREK